MHQRYPLLSIKLLILTCAIGVGIAFTSVGFAEQGRYYVGAGGNLDFHEKVDAFTQDQGIISWLNSISILSVRADGIDFDTGYGASIFGGYAYKNMRFELELAMRYFNLKNFGLVVQSTGGTVSGDFNLDGRHLYISAMVNAYYDFHLVHQLYLTLGAGIGYNRTQIKIDNVAGVSADISDGSNNFAYQLIAGPTYQVNEDWFLSLSYKFFGITRPSVSIDDVKVTYTAPIMHSIELSVRRLL